MVAPSATQEDVSEHRSRLSRGEVRWTRFILCIDALVVTNFVSSSSVCLNPTIVFTRIHDLSSVFDSTLRVTNRSNKKTTELIPSRLTMMVLAFEQS